MAETVLKIEGLHKYFGSVRAVDGISLTVNKGDVYGFLGPNGSGKTTTIRCMLGLITPKQGEVEVCGHNINTDLAAALAKVGVVVETPTLYQYLSGRKNLQLFADLKGVGRQQVDELLELVGLAARAGQKVSKYSLGMKQRLGLAQALLGNPELVVLDEPTNGLDPKGTREIRELIKSLSQQRQVTFFISSHLLHEVEQVCNRVGILRRGKMVSEGYVAELLSSDELTYALDVSDRQHSKELLGSQDFVRSLEEDEGKLLVTVVKGNSGEISKLLVNNGITVNSIAEVPRTLESFFIEITGEEGDQIA